ncbi:MAG: Recombination protein RecR [Parcubacteria group bacterium GW2011_GWB2_40_8]|nr:MAG: Recombination protein RecR [Parcubacteria group bacterium GW2011_GWF2_40_10]KKR47628.1 MAG: Recombination protein RecR [Parcubacteria group bacterium GW2011_GWA2_40_143]KKR59993.1 MAG: Recombination protein RecR [Parcubacteria group bacterium GW2011_GWC2_40_31]KKR75527.1 MAG: Recombination protein RecR [Parcubacteria group bacterium GW2011_GWB2_40_8]KKR82714.1 MAG: Recombination protein RecR [Parcubacteria group bacterium GW2011_GWD2_40_9]
MAVFNMDKLIEYFLKFPGIGPRQAKRFAYFIAAQDESYVKNLAELILKVKRNSRTCVGCFRIFDAAGDGRLCDICSSPSRGGSIMVVEKNVDLENIEKSGAYRGKYFVLGGVMPLTGNNKNGIRLKELFEKIKKEKPEEIILATSATTEGENTNRYIENILNPLGVKITKLGRGLSVGAELEYSDGRTIANALEGRH